MYEDFPNDQQERSYGIIPLRYVNDAKSTEVLVIQHLSTSEWGFPKGHAEQHDLNPLAAASRELLEETGGEIVKYLFDPYNVYFESTYTNSRTGKTKTTTVWAAEVDPDARVTIQPEEIMAYRFVNIHEAHEVLSWKEDKASIARLIKCLEDI